MKKISIIISLCICVFVIFCVIDFIFVSKTINKIQQASPQFHSGVEGCINSHLLFNIELKKPKLDECFKQSILTSSSLQSVNPENYRVLSDLSNQGEFLSFKLLFQRSKISKDSTQQMRNLTYIDINELNYFNYRLSKKGFLVFEILLSEVLNSWIHTFTNQEIETLEIDTLVGRPGGRITGMFLNRDGNKYVVRTGDWLVEANITSTMNFIKDNSDSLVLHGMWKNKENNVLILDPAFAYSANDSITVKFLREKRLSQKGL